MKPVVLARTAPARADTGSAWRWLWWVCLLACLGLAGPATAQASRPATVTLNALDGQVALAGRSEFLIDPIGRLRPDDFEADGTGPWRFALRPAGHRVLMTDGDVLWVRFRARNLEPQARWLLEVALPGVDEAVLYYRDAGGHWVTQRAGDSLPQDVWPQRGREPFFTLSSDTGRDVTYYLRVHHERVPFSGQLFIKTSSRVAEQEQTAQFLLGAYFGLTLLAVLVAIGNAVAYRDRAFALYSIYVAAMALGQAGLTGAGSMLLWPHMPGLSNPVTFFMPTFAGAAGAFFVRSITTPRQYSVLLDRLAVGVIVALLGVAALDVFVPSVAGFDLSMHLLTLSMLLVMLLLALAIARGDRHSRWIAAGFSLIIIGGVFPVARNYGLMASGFLSEYGLMLGSALEMPLLFFGLSRRLSEQTSAIGRARSLDVTDPLTGLVARARLLRLVQGALERLRPGRHFALVVVDMANYPALAREFGREVADRALVLAAARLRTVVREGDVVARVGPQHFALLLESPCQLDEANAIATHVVAQGLRPSGTLPGVDSLRFHVVLAIAPVGGRDAEGLLGHLLQELEQITLDARKTIRILRD